MTSDSQTDRYEALSALADGETSDWEVRKILQQAAQAGDSQVDDVDYRARWQSYQLIGSVLRREPISGVDLSARISQAIAGQRQNPLDRLRQWTRPMMQTAVAAGVAAVSVVGVQQYQLANQGAVTGTNQQFADAQRDISTLYSSNLPQEFVLPIATQTVSSVEGRASNAGAAVQVLSLQIPVFDREALRQHFEQSLQSHSQHSSDASGFILPNARVPLTAEGE